MIGASAAELLDLVAQMDEFQINPNTASFNLVLKAMYQANETLAAEKLIERLDFVLFFLYNFYVEFIDLKWLIKKCFFINILGVDLLHFRG